MKSTMTEGAARKKLAERFHGNGAQISGLLWNAVCDALELEFAPEPVALPASLIFYHGEITPGSLGEENAHLGTWSYPPEQHRAKTLAAAADRYNAYPGLRKAAEALHAEMVRLWPDPSTYGRTLIDRLRAVEAELAKGPK